MIDQEKFYFGVFTGHADNKAAMTHADGNIQCNRVVRKELNGLTMKVDLAKSFSWSNFFQWPTGQSCSFESATLHLDNSDETKATNAVFANVDQ